MELTFTGRGVTVDDELKETARHKLARLERMDPRVIRIDLEFISESHPTLDGTKRVEAAMHTPRKSFRAHAEAEDVQTALDRLTDRLERQLRDHHGKRRSRLFRRFRRSGKKNPLDSASRTPGPADTAEE
ncbi:MAG TPA: ribosome-associated translation inhibitor RaiA [Actinomycetota bacterium]